MYELRSRQKTGPAGHRSGRMGNLAAEPHASTRILTFDDFLDESDEDEAAQEESGDANTAAFAVLDGLVDSCSPGQLAALAQSAEENFALGDSLDDALDLLSSPSTGDRDDAYTLAELVPVNVESIPGESGSVGSVIAALNIPLPSNSVASDPVSAYILANLAEEPQPGPSKQRESKESKAHKCEICLASFTRKHYLNIHRRTHTGERPYRCDVCGRRCINSSNLKSHMHTHEKTKEKPHECTVCQKRFATKQKLTRHENIHTAAEIYECNVCQKRFTQSENRDRHQRRHTGVKTHICNVCRKLFADRSHLTEHMRIHTGEMPYKCNVCQAAFKQSNQLKRHKHSRHSGPIAEEAPQEERSTEMGAPGGVWHAATMLTFDDLLDDSTDESGAAASLIADLNAPIDSSSHAEWAGPVNAALALRDGGSTMSEQVDAHVSEDLVPASAPEDVALATEMEAVRASLLTEGWPESQLIPGFLEALARLPDNEPESSSDSETSAAEAAEVSRPQTRASLQQSLVPTLQKGLRIRCVCEKCGKAYARPRDLDRHRLECGMPSHWCRISNCTMAFPTSAELRKHQRAEHGARPGAAKTSEKPQQGLSKPRNPKTDKTYKCKYCQKSLSSSGGRSKHERTHTGLKPYKCGFCEKHFAQNTTRNRHELTHTAVKRYACDVCPASFTQKHSLTRHHERKHAGREFTPTENRLYACDSCSKSFTTKTNLTVHQRTHTAERPYQCEFCGTDFAHKSNLVVHRRLHTGERPHQCNICGKGFIQRIELVKHLKSTHSGNKKGLLR